MISNWSKTLSARVLADQLGGFLHALHRIPLDEHSQPTLAPTRHDQWLDLRQRVETKLFPLLLPFQASWMRRLLSYVDKANHFDFLPCLIHGDLACYHLLYCSRGQIALFLPSPSGDKSPD